MTVSAIPSAISGRAAAPASALANRLCASDEVFNHHGRKPWASVNFITAHDGFTLNDLVTYNDKAQRSERRGQQGRHLRQPLLELRRRRSDGRPAINELRERQMRNMLGTLLLSQGTPMMLAGDEFARTQKGNNNAYCQDNEHELARLEHLGQGPVADAVRPEADGVARTPTRCCAAPAF